MNRLSAPVATSSLLVADAECGQIQDLISGSKAPVLALTAQAQGRVLGQISEGLLQQRKAGQPVRTLHLIAHGRPGAFRIGDGWIDAEALKAHAADLAHWGVETIALWSCHVGADADFVALLAELSGAQVLASADWLGRDADGKQQLQLGDWRLSDLVKQESWPAQFRLEKDEDKLKPGIYFTADNGSHIYLNGKQLKFDLGGGKTAPGTWDWRQGFYSPLDNIVIEAGKNVLAIAAWDSEEIAGINGHFKFSDSVEISTSDKNGWWVYNADTRMDGRYTPDGTTGLYSYQIKDEDKGLGKDGSKIHGQFPEDEDALISLFEAVDGESPDIPDSEGEKNLHWTEVDYQMKKAPDRSEGLILEGFWVNPGRSKAINGDKNPSPWPAGGDTDQTPDTTWLWYGERLLYEGKDPATDYPSKDKDGEDKNPNNDWTKHNYSLFRLEFDALFAITGRGMCEEETDFGSTSQFVKAGFTIEFDGPLNGSKTFDFELTGDGGDVEFGIPDGGLYAFNADGPVEGVELIEGTLSYDKRTNTYSGQLLVEDGVEGLELGARWEKKSGDLTGQENVTLTFSEGNGQEGGVITTDTKTVVLDEDGDGMWEKDCPPLSPAALFTVTASAACENEKTEPLTDASFTFEVKGAVDPASGEQDSLKGMYSYVLEAEGKRVGSEYAGYSYRIEDVNGRQLDNKKVVVQPDGDGKGTLEVLTDLREFRVVFDVGSLVVGDQLVGDEEVTLKLSNTVYTVSDEATASLKNDDLGCDSVESNPVFTITPTAACENEATALLTDASFTFSVQGAVDPGSRERDSLKGMYDYVLLVDGERVGSEYAGYDYRIEDINGNSLRNVVRVDEGEVGDGVGTLEVNENISEFRVVFDVEALADGDQLSGDESVTLSLARRGTYANDYAYATASLADDDLGCDPLVDPDDQEIFLEPFAACVKDGVLSSSTAEFVFNGEFKPSTTEAREVAYVIDTSSGLLDGDYALNLQFSNGISLKEGGSTGVLEVEEGVGDFSIEITAAAADSLTGDESITLTLYDESEVITKTASLDKLDCAPEPEDKGKTDVQLYLLMDNSTSMLQSDPSTALAGQANRLESQDRVSLYAYQQALEKAGYGFSRKGESGVLSTAAFKDAVIKNSAADLAEVLNDFEVIVDPNHSGNAQDLTLHLISYGYAVDYGSFTITADDPSAGKQAAEAIIGLQTPDQIYGNSIDGNTLWSERGLPTVTADDTFWGEGRPASNLYSGTEMLGALEGLEHLLAAQLNRGAADPITTYISMTTDGRPERRAWWDTRIGPGSDSLTGQPVPLPGSLGGDAITTSGLIYDLDGDATFLNNNAGEQQWTAMQNRLNATLDAIAAQQADPSNRLQVSVLGMGDGSDANFPAIYSDLFGLRTFNNSAGGWSYDYNTSYALPDFFG